MTYKSRKDELKPRLRLQSTVSGSGFRESKAKASSSSSTESSAWELGLGTVSGAYEVAYTVAYEGPDRYPDPPLYPPPSLRAEVKVAPLAASQVSSPDQDRVPCPVSVPVVPGEDPDRDRVASLVDPSPVIDPVGVEARVPRAAVPSPDRDRYPYPCPASEPATCPGIPYN